MASFNKVILLGNLTRDPEVRYTPKGSAVCDLGIAINRQYTLDSGEKREEVTFVKNGASCASSAKRCNCSGVVRQARPVAQPKVAKVQGNRDRANLLRRRKPAPQQIRTTTKSRFDRRCDRRLALT